jgi:uncharacterized Zn finger protein
VNEADDIQCLKTAIDRQWSCPPGEKTQRYVGKFFNATRMGTKLAAQVEGNHGLYRVTLEAQEGGLVSTCSCYIGKHGGCHHCHALALTFLAHPKQFTVLQPRPLEDVHALPELEAYLRGVTLDDLVAQLKKRGITQKAFAASIGMSTQHLSAVKASERRNRYFHELGALKLACLWVLEHFEEKDSRDD